MDGEFGRRTVPVPRPVSTEHTPADEEGDKVVSIRVSDFEADVDFDTPERWRGVAPNWYEAAEQWLSLAPR